VNENARDIARDIARSLATTELFERSRHQRKEGRDAVRAFEAQHALRTTPAARITGASDEFLLAATVQNLKEAGQVDLAAKSIDDNRSRRLAKHADPLCAAILILLRSQSSRQTTIPTSTSSSSTASVIS
jgi:hypothetical protein